MRFDLVFEGGGAKGAAFVGALEEFEARGHTPARLVGTSAGAVTATLLAAGCGARELWDAVVERSPDGRPVFTTFMDVPEGFEPAEVRGSSFARILQAIDLPFIPDSVENRMDAALLDRMLGFSYFRQIFSFVEKGGPYSGARFLAWMHDRIDRKAPGLGDAPFREFARRTGSDLSLIASDIDGETMLVLNHRTAPDCPVAWAVRMSMSIPFVWQEVIWRKEWGPYLGRDIAGHSIVDGGVLSNFPMHLLTSDLAEVVAIMGESDPQAVPNIGFLIDEELPVEGTADAGSRKGLLARLAEARPIRRVRRLVETMMNAHDHAVIDLCLAKHEICRLPAAGYSATDFDMGEERLRALVEAARRAARAYFDRRDPPAPYPASK